MTLRSQNGPAWKISHEFNISFCQCGDELLLSTATVIPAVLCEKHVASTSSIFQRWTLIFLVTASFSDDSSDIFFSWLSFLQLMALMRLRSLFQSMYLFLASISPFNCSEVSVHGSNFCFEFIFCQVMTRQPHLSSSPAALKCKRDSLQYNQP